MKQQTSQPLKTRIVKALLDGLASVGTLYGPSVMPLGMSRFQSPGSTYLSDMWTARYWEIEIREQA